MKNVGYLSLLVGLVSLVLGIASKLFVLSIGGMESSVLMQFAQTCFLLTIAISLGPKVKSA